MFMYILRYVIGGPGRPLAIFLAKFKEMGDGTGNETEIIETEVWSVIFGIIIWTLAILAAIWVWQHVEISFR